MALLEIVTLTRPGVLRVPLVLLVSPVVHAIRIARAATSSRLVSGVQRLQGIAGSVPVVLSASLALQTAWSALLGGMAVQLPAPNARLALPALPAVPQ